MRILLTAVVGGRPHDLAIDAEDDARVLDLAAGLTTHLPARALAPQGPAYAELAPPPPSLRVVAGQPAGQESAEAVTGAGAGQNGGAPGGGVPGGGVLSGGVHGNGTHSNSGYGDGAHGNGTGRPDSGANGKGNGNGARLPSATEESSPQLRPALYLGSRVIPPEMALRDSPIRHGALVGVGAPVPDVLAEPTGLVQIRISGGPASGKVTRLVPGDYVIGTAESAAVRLPDIGLPAVCLHLRVLPDGEVQLTPESELAEVMQHPVQRNRRLPGPIVLAADEEISQRKAGESTYDELPPGTRTTSAEDPAPLMHLEREPLTAGQIWEPGQGLVIGPCLLELSIPTAPDASLSPSPQGATLDYNRPPRLLPPERETTFSLPAEPERPTNQPLPWPMMLAPMLMGAAMFYFTRSPLSLMIVAISPIMLIGNMTSGRSRNKKRYQQQFAEFVARTRKVQGDAFEALHDERAARRRDFADPGEILLTAIGPRARLWERRRTDPDWLTARVGTADQPSSVAIKVSQRESHEGDLAWTAPDVPVTVDLAGARVTGISGPIRHTLARWVMVQSAVLHSPVDLRMVLLSTPEAEAQWRWARWLPHLRSPDSAPELAQVGLDEETTQARIGELLREMESRIGRLKEHGASGTPPFEPMLVVLDGSRRLRLLPGMVPLLQTGPAVNIFFLCLDDDQRLLPEECSAVVQGAEPWSTVRRTSQEVVEAVRPDLVSVAWAERVCRAIAPVRDVSAEDAAAGIPNSSRLLDVLKLDPPSSEAVQQRWQRIGRSTTAVIGEGADGVFAIDMVKDGPHGLVAGTTGSGKSELLQTIIAALAIDNRPDEMTFVLVDYKGGAAFKDCNKLPHTVGMVTDLDGHLTTRALESLGAELRRREHQLAGADAKDIEDYLAAKAPDDEPMPRLLIVIDEFAALVAELPDFVTGLVDIARRGRSLGVHLILATQRPAGVVSAEIKSNTNLRIALRVTDAGDSQDVIEAKDAAHIAKSTPGRAFARLGHSSLIPFQSSRVGGRPRGEGQTADITLREMPFAALGSAPAAGPQVEEDASTPTDLTSVVVACQEASAASGVVAPPSPWLPALEEQITLDALLAEFTAAVPTAERMTIPFGMVDVPSEQRRDVASYDLRLGGHLAIAGAPRSGRSGVLRAFAGAIGKHLSPEDVHVYGVDCGNNALLPLVALPHVGAVVKRDENDRMDRLVARLRGVITDRQQELAMQGYADVDEQRRNSAPEKRMPYLVVLFDRWEGFFQAYDGLDGGRLVASWQQILQEGGAVGIRVVMTGDRSLILGRMATLLDDKLMLRMVDPSDFTMVGLTSKQVPNHMPEGRGFRSEGTAETQVALLDEDPAGTAQVRALQEIGRVAKETYAQVPADRRPFRVDVLPVRMAWEDAVELAAAEIEAGRQVPPTSLPVAVGGDTLGIRYLDAVDHGPAVLVTGARRSGRSTTLMALAMAALERGWKLAVITPRVSPLRGLAGREGVIGPFDAGSDQAETKVAFAALGESAEPSLTLVDDLELVGADGWLAELVSAQIEALRDTESMVVGAGAPADMASLYRGPAAAMKKSGSGIMLAPQATQDADMFGTRMNRSVLGQPMPPGGGYYVSAGQVQRVQVILPD